MATCLYLIIFFLHFCESKPDYCLPTDTNCWPSQSEINEFSSNLNGQLVTPSDAQKYYAYVNMTENILYRNQYPPFIIICSDARDIQQSVLFASSHNIQISIISTGHSWSGVSTANYSLQINLSNMQKYSVNDTDPNKMTITVESGMRWGQIYGIADQYGHRMVIGAADPSVGPSGYALGGGHSPISAAYGLSTDFTTEYYMVDAKANIIHVYNTSGANETIDDLFWALRGGGGGTFGVVINMTFLMHNPVENAIFTVAECSYSFYEYPVIRSNYILDNILNNFFELIVSQELDPNWSGYVMIPLSDLGQDILAFRLIFYGNSTYALLNSKPIFELNMPYNNSLNFNCSYVFAETYLQFSSNIPPFTNGVDDVIVFNDLIPSQNLTKELTQTMGEFFNSSNILDGFIRCMTSVLIGGALHSKNNDFTSVHPAWRHSAMELGFSFYWSDTEHTENVTKHSNEWQSKFFEFGYGKSGAIYSNEQDFSCSNCNWQQMFWGTQYTKLLKVKQKLDPNQVFWCHHCVGDDYD